MARPSKNTLSEFGMPVSTHDNHISIEALSEVHNTVSDWLSKTVSILDSHV